MTPRSRPVRSVLPVVATVLAAVVVAGCGGAQPQESAQRPTISVPPTSGDVTTTTRPPTATVSGPETVGSADDPLVGALDAIATAEAATGGRAFEIDSTSGGWEVELDVDGAQVDVRTDRSGREVRAVEQEGRTDRDEVRALDRATLTLAEAIERAAAEVGGRLDDATLDDEGAGFAWEVTFVDGGLERDVIIDVATGEVLRVEVDD